MGYLRKPFQFVLLSVLFLLLLSGCKSKDVDSHGVSAPAIIETDGGKVPVLSALGDDVAVLEEYKEPAPATVDEEGNEVPAEEGPITYQYTDVEDSGQTVSDYVSLLTSDEYNFNIVNAAGKSVDAPDFSAEEGGIVLSRPDLEHARMTRFVVTWEPGQCKIAIAVVDALPARTAEDTSVSSPQGEVARENGVNATGSGRGSASGGSAMGAEDVVSYFESLSPSALGLPGESMEEYNIYYMEGKVLVNNEPCVRVRIYTVKDPEGSNAYMGTFLVGGKGNHIYKHDIDNDLMIEMT